MTQASAVAFHPAVTLVDGKPIVSSRAIADDFGKRHDDVLKKIQAIDCSPVFSARNFAGAEYVDAQGKVRPMYEITRDGFMFLVMGFTGPRAAAIKEAYIAAFNMMEAALKRDAAGLDGALIGLLAKLIEGQQVLMEKSIALQERTLEVLERLAPKPKNRPRRTPLADDIPGVVKMHGDGLSYREITNLTGLSETVVYCIVVGEYEVRPDGGLRLTHNLSAARKGGAS